MKTGKAMALAGSWLQLGLIAGPALTAAAMMRAFGATSRAGGSDPAGLSEDIGTALSATLIGMGVALVGVVLMAVAVLGCGYAERWLFRSLVASGIVWMVFFPAGTILGAAILTVTLWQRKRFAPSDTGEIRMPS